MRCFQKETRTDENSTRIFVMLNKADSKKELIFQKLMYEYMEHHPLFNGHYGKMLYCYTVRNIAEKRFSKGAKSFIGIDEIKE